ncbi:MAG: hypothetical protein EPN23_07765 [Verrucomicrobia bacterium]|nr:MAG: hypothetical protein EPN23_07765 [Verrucomicrobiota bacterium]
MARIRLLVVAGVVKSFPFDFATRVFELRFVPDLSKGESEIFVPTKRHFPDGCRRLDNGMVPAFAPASTSGFHVSTNPHKMPATGFRWDGPRNRVVVGDRGPAAGAAMLQTGMSEQYEI